MTEGELVLNSDQLRKGFECIQFDSAIITLKVVAVSGHGDFMHIFLSGHGDFMHIFLSGHGDFMHIFLSGHGDFMHIFLPCKVFDTLELLLFIRDYFYERVWSV